ncbi:MAG: hypothetical protein U9R13_04235 [Campylobacterota bacterium]|nr:hypothetical protein [Campylobacterota bacterium]
MKKMINIVLIAAVSILFTACTSSSVAPVVKSPSFQLGETDGCKTATGVYTKDGNAFDKDKEYKDGWYAGRKNCNPAQAK